MTRHLQRFSIRREQILNVTDTAKLVDLNIEELLPVCGDDLQELEKQGMHVELENTDSVKEEPKKLSTDFLY